VEVIFIPRYGKNEYLKYCRDIDQRRDELELMAVEVAFDRKMPVLGICRGISY
jgi:gamma-glutamyl-gamma-aminobutyrate hydrolase PuuD